MFPDRIETDRLALESLTTEYPSWDPHETPTETLEFLEAAKSAWKEATK